MKHPIHSIPESLSTPSPLRRSRRLSSLARLLLLSCWGLLAAWASVGLSFWGDRAVAQAPASQLAPVQTQEDRLIQEFTLPSAPPLAPSVTEAAPVPNEPPSSEPPSSEPNWGTGEPAPTEAAVPEADPGPAPQSSPSSPATPVAGNASTAKTQPGTTGQSSLSQYVLTFNRSPIVGNRLRLEGVHSEARLGFTRPAHWQVRSLKALVRYQHSPALVAKRSNLTVRINGTSVGSTPMNQPDSKIGEFLVDVPLTLLQDTNEISVVAQQNNAKDCPSPADPSLWTEVLPDSKLIFAYQPQAIALDFSRFPYPFFDALNLDPTPLVYIQPAQPSADWLTAAARFQALMGRAADFHPLETRLAKNFSDLKESDRGILIGTPAEQPLLASLLRPSPQQPFSMRDGKILDGKQQALPPDTGLLILTTPPTGNTPLLVVSGNSPAGVAKAIQYLVQPEDRKTATGQAILVTKLTAAVPPPARAWKGHLPVDSNFTLSALPAVNGQPFQDTTVRGPGAPLIEFAFRALPDDRFVRGNVMDLVFSYGAQANPRTSSVDVLLDGVAIASKRLTSKDGANRETFNVALPENLIKPTSKIQVLFQLNPRESDRCGVTAGQKLWGTVHSDTRFRLNRENSVQLPDLRLLSVGYPFAAPQDLSATAIVVPDAPSQTDLITLLEFSARLGRLSQADSVQVQAYTTKTLPESVRQTHHLVGVGVRERFPVPEVFQPDAQGFSLGNAFLRQWFSRQAGSEQAGSGEIVTLPDQGGVIKQIISPWNKERVLLALSAQTEPGLKIVETVLRRDRWFYQLQGDTVLVNAAGKTAGKTDPMSTDHPDAYRLEFLQQSRSQRWENVDGLSKVRRFLQDHWLMLPVGLVTFSFILYGIAQLYLKRVAGELK